MPAKAGLSASPDTDELIISIPNIKNANPIRMPPTSFFFDSPLHAIRRIIPIAASIGENDVGLSKFIRIELPSIPVRESIHDVTVVPMLAPMITPTA